VSRTHVCHAQQQFSDDEEDSNKGRRTPKPGKPTKSQSSTPGGEESDGGRQGYTTPRRALSRADSGNRLRSNLGRSFDSVDSLINGQRKGSMGSSKGAAGGGGSTLGGYGGGANVRKTSDEEKRHQRKQEKAREKELGIKRSGVAERVEGLALLNSGLAVYVPHTQVHARVMPCAALLGSCLCRNAKHDERDLITGPRLDDRGHDPGTGAFDLSLSLSSRHGPHA
jgi:hypothetical protein